MVTNVSDVVEKVKEISPISEVIQSAIGKILQGLQLISQGISNIIFLPFNYLGITVSGTITQAVYLIIIIYLIYKLSSSWKLALGIIVLLIIISLPQLSSLL